MAGYEKKTASATTTTAEMLEALLEAFGENLQAQVSELKKMNTLLTQIRDKLPPKVP